jgi:hypothetical protein
MSNMTTKSVINVVKNLRISSNVVIAKVSNENVKTLHKTIELLWQLILYIKKKQVKIMGVLMLEYEMH